jgi:hypothetical protein
MTPDMNHDSYPFDPAAIPSDPRIDALLDEALSPDHLPGGMPAGLADRIVAATVAHLPRQSPARPQGWSLVFTASRLRWAGLAAAVAVVAGLIIANLPGSAPMPVQPGPHDVATNVDHLDRDLQLAANETGKLTDPVTPAIADVRQDIALIKDRLDGELASAVESWSDVTRELEAALAEIDSGPRG